MMRGGAMEMSGAMWVGMALWGLLVVSLVALSIAGTVRLMRGGHPRQLSAREELDARYARGEIERDRYLQRRADLTDAGGAGRR